MSIRDQALAELATLGTGSGDALALLREVRRLAVFADQVLGQLARLVGLVDSTGAYAEVGYTSAAAFLRHGCGRSAGRAGELVAVGRALPRLSATGKAMEAGEVSFDAAHVICRTADQIDDTAVAGAAEQQMLSAVTVGRPGARPPDEEGWVRPGLDPRELRRLGEDLAYRADPDAVEERQKKRFERRYLSFGLTLDGAGTISGACSDGLSTEIIKTAAEAFSPPGGTEDNRTAAQRRMDGLTAACQAALDSGKAGSRHQAMPHISVLMDADGNGKPGAGRTVNGALLTAAQILTLACRAEISLIKWRDGLPLDVGR
ncbi:MAG: DUF222 domain-containing protein, partial [Actinobacteria bacterium]|nr:DUF222 domain-containing protein [Actinomycetota bacterium]